MTKINPTFYAIIPAYVRYDEVLTPLAKLLFGEISALANTQGFCNASNSYFAKLYGVSVRHISDLVTSLVGEGCVTVEVDKAAGNKRKIRIAMPMELQPDTYGTKVREGYGTKVLHNNTSNNNINPTLTTDLDKHALKAYHLYLKYFIDGDTAAAEKRYRLTPKRTAALKRRLKDAEPKMVWAAIVGFGRDDFYTGRKDGSTWKADLADYICRSYENIEKGARLYEQQQAKPGGDDAWAALN